MSRWLLGQQLLPLTALRGLRPVIELQKALRRIWYELTVVSEVAVRRYYHAPWEAAGN
jgi:hypothetical protein